MVSLNSPKESSKRGSLPTFFFRPRKGVSDGCLEKREVRVVCHQTDFEICKWGMCRILGGLLFDDTSSGAAMSVGMIRTECDDLSFWSQDFQERKMDQSFALSFFFDFFSSFEKSLILSTPSSPSPPSPPSPPSSCSPTLFWIVLLLAPIQYAPLLYHFSPSFFFLWQLVGCSIPVLMTVSTFPSPHCWPIIFQCLFHSNYDPGITQSTMLTMSPCSRTVYERSFPHTPSTSRRCRRSMERSPSENTPLDR